MGIIKIGQYRHYKGHLCEVVGVGKHTESGEEFVVYKHPSEALGDCDFWIRPKKMFLEAVNIDGKEYKKYRGMASRDAMTSWKGNIPDGITDEGEMTLKPYKGSVVPILDDLCGGIRSGLTYSGASNISDFCSKAVFLPFSVHTAIENGAHGK